jgi:hypothetical protein
MIDQLDYCTPDLRTNPGTNIPFIGESSRGYESVIVGMFKDPFLMGIFPLPAPDTTHIAPINMICSSTSESLGSVDPWLVPHTKDVDSHGSSIPSNFFDTGQQIHPHVECDQPSSPIQEVDSFNSHDFHDIKLPLDEVNSKVMASIDKSSEDEYHHTFLTDLELMRLDITSLDSRLGAFTGESSATPSLDPYPPHLSFSKLSTKLFAFPPVKDLCFLLP